MSESVHLTLLYARASRVWGNPAGGRARPETATEYDKNGNITKLTDANSNATDNVYDGLNRLTKTTDAENISVENDYDAIGNLIKVEDGKGQLTEFEYDGLKRNTKTLDPVMNSTTLTYNALQMTKRVDAQARTTDYVFNKRNKLTKVTYGSSPQAVRDYTYDKNENILTVVETDTKKNVTNTYDALDRLATEVSAGEAHSYKYDLAGNVLLTEYGGTTRKLESTYNELNLLSQIDEVKGSTTRTTTYEYDLNLNVTKKTLPGNQATTTTFDELNRATQITNGAATYDQVFDLVDNILEIAETYPSNSQMDRTVTNTYDDIYRLEKEAVTAPSGGATPKTTEFEYDAANNRTKRTIDTTTVANYIYNNRNQLTQYVEGTKTVDFEFDSDGNRTKRTEGTDVTTYEYDFDNRLKKVTKDAVDYEYIYDYRTRRIERDEDGTATRIVFSGGVSVEEFDSSDVLQVEFIRGSGMGGGIGSILYSIRNDVASLTNYNQRGDVVSKTSDTGTVTYQAEYDAFGEHPVETGSTLDRQKANTKEEDPTGLLNEGMRYRDLETGEFITRDPLGYVDGPNLYAYVGQNPWSKFDPLGLELEEPTKREVREETRESDEVHNTMVDRYDYTKQNSPAFNKIVDHLKGTEGKYRIEVTDSDRSSIKGNTAYISQQAIKESTEKTVEALAEELGHLTQNAGQASAVASPEFANATTAEERSRITQKGMDAANLGVFVEADVQAEAANTPGFNAREAQAGRISNIVATEVRISTAEPGDEPFYSGNGPKASIGGAAHVRTTYSEGTQKRDNGNRIVDSMHFSKPFGSYQFEEMIELWSGR